MPSFDKSVNNFRQKMRRHVDRKYGKQERKRRIEREKPVDIIEEDEKCERKVRFLSDGERERHKQHKTTIEAAAGQLQCRLKLFKKFFSNLKIPNLINSLNKSTQYDSRAPRGHRFSIQKRTRSKNRSIKSENLCF